MEKNFILPILAIIFILVFVFLSQQIYFKQVGQNLISAANNQAGAQLSKGSAWVNTNVVSKVAEGSKSGGAAVIIVNSTDKKNNSENILKKTENYFSGIANSITKPGTPQNCPPVTTPTK